MAEAARATVRIIDDRADDGEEIARLTARLRDALLDLDVLDVEPVTEEAPDGAKGGHAVVGWLSVTLGADLLSAIVDRLANWATGLGRTVEISVGGDSLKLGRVSREEQRELTRAWLARHPVDPSPQDGRPASPERGYL